MIPASAAELTNVRLLYKRAWCAILTESAREHYHGLDLLRQAERELPRGMERGRINKAQRDTLDVLSNVVRGSVLWRNRATLDAKARAELLTDSDTEDADSLLGYVEAILNDRDKQRRLQRDELELMMFAVRNLVEDARAHRGPGNPYRAAFIDDGLGHLSSLCRLVQVASGQDTLAYLRPYYDLIITTQIYARPPNVKLLMDLALQASLAEVHEKVVAEQPALMFYFTRDNRAFALLDVSRGASKAFVLQDHLPLALKQKRALILPPELLAELRKLNGAVDLHWHDPVHSLNEGSDFLFAFRDSVPNLRLITRVPNSSAQQSASAKKAGP